MSTDDFPPQPPSPLPLMELSTGFWAFKTLAAAHELGLFAGLDELGSATVPQVAAKLEIADRPARMLLTGCAALGLLETGDGGAFANSALAAAYLVPSRPYYFGGWVRILDRRLYPGWGRLTEALRTNAPTTWDPRTQESLFSGEDPALLETFWQAMHSLSSSTARRLARAAGLGSYRRLLDVGGGSGAYAIELCRAHPSLRATVFDLPHVCPIAAAHAAEAGLGERIAVHPGDFLNDASLPPGHDLILLSMVLHDWDEPTGRALLTKCHAALPPGGAVVISELMVDDDRSGPVAAALMGLNMLVETVGGENYTAAEYSRWLTGTGFQQPRTVLLDAPGANQALVAVRS
ncbi:methyltransferase [Streptomyces sp. NPDC051162]|uniref:methyltransferase n=1 Tax=unclassified Streptomyces TaxID=2593676 RepID=UPI003414B8C5